MVEPVPSQHAPVEVKGSLVRAVVLTLEAHGLREQVLALVSPEAGALIREPPLATRWIEARLHDEILEALLQLLGPDGLRALNREAVERGVHPLLRGTAMRLLRVFGTSPAALLSRFDRVSGTTARGVVYSYTPTGPMSGWFEIEYPTMREVPLGAFIATGGALSLVFDLCGAIGTFGEPEWVPNGRRNCARFAVAWR
jgi:hypothetical protein